MLTSSQANCISTLKKKCAYYPVTGKGVVFINVLRPVIA